MVTASQSLNKASNSPIGSAPPLQSYLDRVAESMGLEVMIKKASELTKEQRHDFDYYEPTKELEFFPDKILRVLDNVLTFSTENRDPAHSFFSFHFFCY